MFLRKPKRHGHYNNTRVQWYGTIAAKITPFLRERLYKPLTLSEKDAKKKFFHNSLSATPAASCFTSERTDCSLFDFQVLAVHAGNNPLYLADVRPSASHVANEHKNCCNRLVISFRTFTDLCTALLMTADEAAQYTIMKLCFRKCIRSVRILGAMSTSSSQRIMFPDNSKSHLTSRIRTPAFVQDESRINQRNNSDF